LGEYARDFLGHSAGFKLNTCTFVNATAIGAPSSTKNVDEARDPEMLQTRKGPLLNENCDL
jgi:hypothetical protein